MKWRYGIAVCVVISIVLCTAIVTVGKEAREGGGFIIGYPTQPHETELPPPEIPVGKSQRRVARPLIKEQAPAEQYPEVSSELTDELIERNRMIAMLNHKLQAKDKHIRILEQRLDSLTKKLEQKEMELFVIQPQVLKIYEVRRGDSLWKIAGRKDVYGNPYLWIKIFNANMKKIQNENLIYPGQLFEIPK